MAYYMTKQFQQNKIFDLLKGEKFTRVVSIDMGHGRTRAWLYEKEKEGWTGKALKLDAEGSTCIPTRISYDQKGEQSIGYEADPVNFLQQFKTAPGSWDKLSPDGTHTFKAMMEDFISYLWFCSLPDCNPELEMEEEDWDHVLLVVGCPFANAWLWTDDFRKLVEEALVHDYVAVLPESSSAVMCAASRGGLDLSSGVTLIDLGAVTTDFLYVQQGKKIIVRSLEWGGNQIDRALLDEILKAKGMARRDVPLNRLAYVLDQVRAIKEEYDPAKAPLERTLVIPKGGQDREILVAVDKELMDKAISPLLPALEGFFRKMNSRIGSRPCSTVLLAGGTSQVEAILTLAKGVFGPGCQVRRLEDPADCVAQGLALTMCGRLRVKALVAQQSQVIEDYLTNRYDGFCMQCSSVVLGSFSSIAHQQLQRIQQAGKLLRFSQIIALIEKTVKAAGLPEDQKLGWHLEDVSNDSLQALSVGIPYLIEDIYAAPNRTDAQALLADTEKELEEKRNKVDLNALMANLLGQTSFKKLFYYTYVDEDILKRYISPLRRGARSAAAALVSLFPSETDNPELWRSSGAFKHYPELLDKQTLADPKLHLLVHEAYNHAQYYITLDQNNPTVDPKIINEILKRADLEQMVYWSGSDWHRRHMDSVLDNCPMVKEIYDRLFRDLYEITLGKLLLLVFDERADIS